MEAGSEGWMDGGTEEGREGGRSHLLSSHVDWTECFLQ